MYLKKCIMIFTFLFVFFIIFNQGCEALGLGTRILLIDRDLYDYLSELVAGNGNKLLERLKLYTEKLKLLLKTVKRPKKRTIQVIACYCNNGCPRFLRLKMPNRETFIQTFNWVEDEYRQFENHINLTQRLKQNLYEIYEREKANYTIVDDYY